MTRPHDHPISKPTNIRQQLEHTIGPAPWYWKTFPAFRSPSGQRFVWTHHGEQGPIAYLITLALQEEPDKPRLALNTYCRPFLIPPQSLGIWCPDGRNLRFACFDPDQLKAFDLAEIAGWFKQSAERIYAASAPLADFEIPIQASPGLQSIEAPEAFRTSDELIVPTSYPRKTDDDPAMALYVFDLKAGSLEVLPQKWFTQSQYDVGHRWISRAARDPESHRIFGECFGVGTFLLEEDGCRLAEWVDQNS